MAWRANSLYFVIATKTLCRSLICVNFTSRGILAQGSIHSQFTSRTNWYSSELQLANICRICSLASTEPMRHRSCACPLDCTSAGPGLCLCTGKEPARRLELNLYTGAGTCVEPNWTCDAGTGRGAVPPPPQHTDTHAQSSPSWWLCQFRLSPCRSRCYGLIFFWNGGKRFASIY
jgi:hypothetical protein